MQLITKNKTYTIEFTFEAAESPIVQLAFDYFSGAYMMKAIAVDKTDSELTESDKLKNQVAQLDALIGGVANMPKLAIDFLFMGLLENHGADGDGTVLNRSDAKRIYKDFCKENQEDALAMHSGLFEALREQMVEDGFFKRIGLEQMMENMSKPNEKTVKMPQDHKKKVNTKA